MVFGNICGVVEDKFDKSKNLGNPQSINPLLLQIFTFSTFPTQFLAQNLKQTSLLNNIILSCTATTTLNTSLTSKQHFQLQQNSPNSSDENENGSNYVKILGDMLDEYQSDSGDHQIHRP